MSINRLSLGVAFALLLGNGGGFVVAERAVPVAQRSGQSARPSTPAKSDGTPSATQRPPDRKPWWTDEAIKKELGLTAEQAKSIDQIYTSAKDEMSAYYEAREREAKELDRLIRESKVEQWVVARQIDKVETQRSNFNKLRTMTLYRMHRQLTPEQRLKLQEIQNRDRRDPRKHP